MIVVNLHRLISWTNDIGEVAVDVGMFSKKLGKYSVDDGMIEQVQEFLISHEGF